MRPFDLSPAAFLSALLLAVATAPLSAQTGVLDQQSPYFFNGMDLSSATGASWQQQIEVGVAGRLEGITFEVSSSVPGDVATVHLYTGTGPHQPGSTPVYTGQVVAAGPTAAMDFVDMSAAGVNLAVGDMVVVEIVADSQAMKISFNSAFFQAIYPQPAFAQQPGGLFTSVAIERIAFDSYMLVGLPSLAVNGSCPGPATLVATNMTPGGAVAFAGSLGTGTTVLSGAVCAGTLVDLLVPRLVAVVNADGAGSASVVGSLPAAAACGSVTLQALDIASCVTTNTAVL